MTPTSAAAPNAPATIAPVESFFSPPVVATAVEGGVSTGCAGPTGEGAAAAGVEAVVGTGIDGTAGVGIGAGTGAEDGNIVGVNTGDGVEGNEIAGIAAPGHLLSSFLPHHNGAGLHAAGALENSRRTTAAVSAPYFPSGLSPSAACAAQTMAA